MCIYSLGRPSNVLSLNEICNYILSPLIKRYKLLLLRKRNYQITFEEEEFTLKKIFLTRRKYIFDLSTLFHKSLPLFLFSARVVFNTISPRENRLRLNEKSPFPRKGSLGPLPLLPDSRACNRESTHLFAYVCVFTRSSTLTFTNTGSP